jgi:hypothetical protein
MPLGIKNFSELTAIDPIDKIAVDIVSFVEGNPDYELTLNGEILRPGYRARFVGLFDNIIIKCEKRSAQGEIKIAKLAINEKMILPRFNHLATDSTNIISKPGIWHLSIPYPFYTWYHKASHQGWIA